ncbi:hypothetical protein EU805_09240 [Salipiger sp. IMCC34102]|uniref:KPN_02809 family neutral zinc metallopeptidase n=1 Tax=Salipiger sp. IMCC34102 TaxID=2510647 RepID=UPI00101C73DB|nr:neutral zinc metallopeptidase [Salipiger sp. IMCC34102]RYH02776.1 hypothetical protein EU805_09240 [Salipiger sp. IMCC34102]
MQWRGRRSSRNIERRGRGGGRAVGGIGGIGAVIVLLLGWYFGIDTSALVGGTGSPSTQTADRSAIDGEDPEMEQFVAAVLGLTEDVWAQTFQQQVGEPYSPPTLVLFDGVTQSACGTANAATGPFYCPSEDRIFLDTQFFRTLSDRLGAGGDFAQAYVIAHEVAHHIQNELGILGQVNRMRAQASPADGNALSVRTELQADCYSGIWARGAEEAFGVLEPGDIEEAMNAAAAIGDDRLQGAAARPDSFTHGTSAQRQRWFARGFDSGNMTDCDTFSATQL